MDDAEAVEICQKWFSHLGRQREESQILMQAAAAARAGRHEEARSLKRQVDSKPRVFDGGTLEPAVRHLVKRVSDE